MPMIIDSNGKARYDHPLNKLFADATVKYLSQLYDELQKVSLNHATGDALDKLAELYGFARKHEQLL